MNLGGAIRRIERRTGRPQASQKARLQFTLHGGTARPDPGISFLPVVPGRSARSLTSFPRLLHPSHSSSWNGGSASQWPGEYFYEQGTAL